jgi:hypothetical protein
LLAAVVVGETTLEALMVVLVAAVPEAIVHQFLANHREVVLLLKLH